VAGSSSDKPPAFAASGRTVLTAIWVTVRFDAPKIFAHPSFLIARASDAQRPPDRNHGGEADNACEPDQHNVEIIARVNSGILPVVHPPPKIQMEAKSRVRVRKIAMGRVPGKFSRRMTCTGGA